MMFAVDVTYRTRLGNLMARMTSSQIVETREEAQELRGALQAMPQLANAVITIKNAKPLPTFDEAMEHFRRGFAEYPIAAEEEGT
jgi:hypothetical protein